MGCQMDSKQYTYRVKWSAEDNGYVGLCAEFPSLSWHDADQSKAFSGIEELVAAVVADMISTNEKVPIVKLLYYSYRIRKKLEITHRLSRSTILYA